jgi:hypothetical protein
MAELTYTASASIADHVAAHDNEVASNDVLGVEVAHNVTDGCRGRLTRISWRNTSSRLALGTPSDMDGRADLYC